MKWVKWSRLTARADGRAKVENVMFCLFKLPGSESAPGNSH